MEINREMAAMTDCEHLVQYYETDQMGVVHHSNYIRWFEEARTQLFEELGLGYKGMEEMGIISRYTGVRFDIKYTIFDKETEQVRCTGTSEHCFINREGKVISMQKEKPVEHARFDELVNGKKG